MRKGMMQEKKEYRSQPVTGESHALDLEEGVFTWKDPARRNIPEQAKDEVRALFQRKRREE
jgi:hypothetical protein